MKKHSKKIIGLFILFIVVSCTLESKFALPNDEDIKTELIGEWLSETDTDGSLSIMKKDEKTYTLQINNEDETERLTAFSKTIKGFNIMNVKTDYKGKITNTFYGFTIDDNILTFYEVNKQLREKEFESDSDLLNFFEANVANQDFFVNPSKLIRK